MIGRTASSAYRCVQSHWSGNFRMNTLISTHSRHLVASVTLALAALTLAGCGGGGGGSAAVTDPNPPAPPTPPTPPTPTTAEITSTRLDTASQDVDATSSDIDDSGRVTVLFAQSDGTRVALHAVDGTPGARGTAPTFTAPTVVDTGAPYDGSGRLRLFKSPSGNAVALWMSRAPCTATSYNTSGQCNFVYTARRLSGGAWDAPLLVGDTPGTLPKGIINDNGDIALIWPSWQRDGQGLPVVISSVVWRPVAASAFNPPSVPTDITTPTGSEVTITLDRLGNMVYASLSNDGNTGPKILVRRGTVAAGFGAAERLDTATNAALEGVWSGTNGQVVVLWQQTDGGQVARWSAALDTPTGAWQTSSRGAPRTALRAGTVTAGVGDNGDFFLYDLGNCVALRRTAGAWQAEASLPTGHLPELQQLHLRGGAQRQPVRRPVQRVQQHRQHRAMAVVHRSHRHRATGLGHDGVQLSARHAIHRGWQRAVVREWRCGGGDDEQLRHLAQCSDACRCGRQLRQRLVELRQTALTEGWTAGAATAPADTHRRVTPRLPCAASLQTPAWPPSPGATTAA